MRRYFNNAPPGLLTTVTFELFAFQRIIDAGFPVVLIDGTLTVQPSIRDLANAVRLQTVPRATEYDAVMSAAGQAGSQPRSKRISDFAACLETEQRMTLSS